MIIFCFVTPSTAILFDPTITVSKEIDLHEKIPTLIISNVIPVIEGSHKMKKTWITIKPPHTEWTCNDTHFWEQAYDAAATMPMVLAV